MVDRLREFFRRLRVARRAFRDGVTVSRIEIYGSVDGESSPLFVMHPEQMFWMAQFTDESVFKWPDMMPRSVVTGKSFEMYVIFEEGEK